MASLAERAGRRRSDIVRQQATRSVSGACRIWLNGSGVRSAVTPSARTLPRALLERLDKIHSGICVAYCDFRWNLYHRRIQRTWGHVLHFFREKNLVNHFRHLGFIQLYFHLSVEHNAPLFR